MSSDETLAHSQFELKDELDLCTDRDGVPLVGARVLSKLPYVPIAFLGLGIYRAWIELCFVGSFISFPIDQNLGHDLFDIVMIAVLFGCAAAADRLGPFFKRRSVYVLGFLSMMIGSLTAFGMLWFADFAAVFSLVAVVSGGIGTALVILIWSELYSCLNPYRVALYYCSSIIVAALIIYVCRGMSVSWVAAVCLVLPVASLVCAQLGFMALPVNELPHVSSTKFSFPWKPTLLMAVYAFAYGLRENSQYASSFGPHSAFGTVVIAVVIFLVIAFQRGRFNFTMLYRVALPLIVGAFLVIPAFNMFGSTISDFCAMAGYTAFSILIMIILANMSYAYGISAIWLFGIERGVRALFSLVGRGVTEGITTIPLPFDGSLVVGSLTVILVIIGTMVLLSEKELTSRWGMSYVGDASDAAEPLSYKQLVMKRAEEMKERFGLSPREVEVLVLLGERKTVNTIHRELFISKDTAKTHIRHLYRKMDVHSRDELLDMLGVSEDE